ncbi:unnamed protein product [Urochloa decumbens]|uniref:Uncharacterized protein n=1 Tax=Urochloa decumbens TaxID=240449 RepID=A0ABC9BU12_9POAL
MGSLMPNTAAVLAAVVMTALVASRPCSGDGAPGPNITTDDVDYSGRWLPARATWYGQPNGAGPDDNGGACGIKDVNLPPYAGMTSCGNLPLFKDGKGCGSCYQIRCKLPECGNPVRVFITDMNYGPVAPYYFDLSGTAFGSMAKPGLNDQLRHRGIVDLDFRRVPCKYAPGQNIVFHVEEGSNPFYLAVLVKFVAVDGDIVQMDLKDQGSPEWQPMNHSWGAIWRADMHRPLKGPISIRITNESGRTLVATDVIPENWLPNTVYNSNIQF